MPDLKLYQYKYLMLDAFITYHTVFFILLLSILLLFKLIHFAVYKRSTWSMRRFLYFLDREIEGSYDYDRGYAKRVQNGFTPSILIITALYTAIEITLKVVIT